MMEILAPCGGYESLSAALNTGADAVYVGMKLFSARKNAENFSDEELKSACSECHKRGVKLYVALNTLMYDSEISEVSACIRIAAECGVDGLIIQDVGVMRLAEKIAPQLPRHASTQMTLNSPCGAAAAKELGCTRAVIGRELSFEQIKQIRDSTDIELEVFVHGALCVCISGQCYMSSVFGGRSGNRGLCAQPCRLDFSYGGRHSVISLKDSSLVAHLPMLDKLGVASCKIEGRMKRPEYVACAVDACRKSLYGEEYDAQRLQDIFSRGGLTDGYFTGKLTDMQGSRGKDDVDSSAKALSCIKALYKDEFPRLSVDIHVEIFAGEPIRAAAKCGSVYVSAEGDIPQTAQNAATTAESVCERIKKLGGTQFFAGEVTAEVGEGLYVPAAALNALRRTLCEKLSAEVQRRNTPFYDIHPYEYTPQKQSGRSEKTRFRAEVSTPRQLNEALSLDFDYVYAPITLLNENIPEKDRVIVLPPLFLGDCESEVRAELLRLKALGFSRGAAMTLGAARMLKECGYTVHGGYRLNVINSLSAQVCAELGMEDITLSFEGTAEQLSRINSPVPTGILAYGRLPLMVMRRCPIADSAPRGLVLNGKKVGCASNCTRSESCGKAILDRRGNELPVLCGGNTVELLNPDTLILSDRQNTLSQFDFAVLKFTTEAELLPVLEMYKTNKKPQGALTRGLYFRGAE